MTILKFFACLLSISVLATPLPKRINGNRINGKRIKGEST